MFFRNPLLNEKNELHNRNLHISGLLNEEKVDIGNVKVDIENEKVDIESVFPEKGSNFSVKTTVHVHDSPQQGGCDLGIYLNPSSIGFKRSLNSEIYVDKTGLIEKTNVLLDTEQKFICVSRPRRFGKSMAVHMLSAYYACGEDSSALFDGLTISHTASYRQHLNQYNVIKVNMQDFLSMTHSMDEMLTMLQKYLSFDLLKQFEHIRFRDENNLIQIMKDIYAKKTAPLSYSLTNGTACSGNLSMIPLHRSSISTFCGHGSRIRIMWRWPI